MVADLAKPWSSVDFFVRNRLTGENIPATIVRLPGGSGLHRPHGYWAFSRKAPYGSCQLEYITDIDKLRSEYDYRAANHPLVGNPCSHTLYDPLKTAQPGWQCLDSRRYRSGQRHPPALRRRNRNSGQRNPRHPHGIDCLRTADLTRRPVVPGIGQEKLGSPFQRTAASNDSSSKFLTQLGVRCFLRWVAWFWLL